MVVYNGSSRKRAYSEKNKYDTAKKCGLKVDEKDISFTKIDEKILNEHYVVVVGLERR